MRFSALSAVTAFMAATSVTAAPTKRALDLALSPAPVLDLVDGLTGKLGLDLNLASVPETLGLPGIDTSELKIRKLLDCILDQLSIDLDVSVLPPSGEAAVNVKRTLPLGLDLSKLPLAELIDTLTTKLGVTVDLSVLPHGLSDLSNVSLEGIQACLAGPPTGSISGPVPVRIPTSTPTSTPVPSIPAVPTLTSVPTVVPTDVPAEVEVPVAQPTTTAEPIKKCKAHY
ncbi:hypothetical protein BJY04DRAFT_223806 [Aspergillus karnatakaensis]|uniref:uncharacterized protein n=1 Tax=Aspergillus karnatakaensis TaxID=1810916 RepID=UPI003CCD3BC2